MADSNHKTKRPTLLRPGSAEYMAWKQARDRAEVPWRESLAGIPREKLVELAVSGAWVSKLLQVEIEKLSAEIERHRASRRQAGINSKPGQKLAKAEIHKEWLDARLKTPGRFNRTRFAHKMVARYGHAITDVTTVVRWTREWEKGLQRAVPNVDVPNRRRADPLPEIYRLLGYLDPDWVKQE